MYFAEKIGSLNPFYLNPVYTVIENSNGKIEDFYHEFTTQREISAKVSIILKKAS